MNIQECYAILGVNHLSSDDDITRSFKRLAMKYHPDKNRGNIEQATKAMMKINMAYTALRSYRFKLDRGNEQEQEREQDYGFETLRKEREAEKARAARKRREQERAREEFRDELRDEIKHEVLTNKFVSYRERAKDALYTYFQYGLFNFARRDTPANTGTYNRVVHALKGCYHSINKLMKFTSEKEVLEHFEIFTAMIFNFYMASECLNILDSYSNTIDVEAFRLYRKGDEALHVSHKEIFYDRHNRGNFKKDVGLSYLRLSEEYFQKTLTRYPQSTWAVESKIKLDYVLALKNYLHLFFSA